MSSATEARIDLGALRRNLGWVRERSAGRRVIGVVKADAYGHGAVMVARSLIAARCEALAVATTSEARVLREAGIRERIFLLQDLREPGDADRVGELDLVPLISSLAALPLFEAAARRTGRRLPVHLKLDTGMGRLGLLPDELERSLDLLRRSPNLEFEGFCSHLADADDPDAATPARQRALFGDLLARVLDAGFSPDWIHMDNSAGIVRGPTPRTTAVRPGIALYGADPTFRGEVELEPSMTLVTRVTRAKRVPGGTRVGYGGSYTTSGETWLLTLPIGYADGLPRDAGSRFSVGFAGRRIPLVGRVSMDLSAADAGPPDAFDSDKDPVGQEVLIFGRGEGMEIRVEELAAAVGTISYEILSRIGQRVERVHR